MMLCNIKEIGVLHILLLPNRQLKKQLSQAVHTLPLYIITQSHRQQECPSVPRLSLHFDDFE